MKINGKFGWAAVAMAPEGDAGGAPGTIETTGDADKGNGEGSALGGGGEGEAEGNSNSALGGKANESSEEGDKGGESNSDSDSNADGEKSGAPDGYEDFTLPEGVKLNDGLMTGFAAWAKENNISQAEAQKLVDINSSAVQKVSEEGAEASIELEKTKNANWIQEQKDHPDFGGSKHEESIALARHAVEQLGGQELRDKINELGIGEEPTLLFVFTRLGALMKDDTIDMGDSNKELTRAERIVRLYPNSDLNAS